MKKRIAVGTTIELAKPGVNLTLLWTEYCSDCYASKLTPYMYTQFCGKYRKWARLTKATMRITHKPVSYTHLQPNYCLHISSISWHFIYKFYYFLDRILTF